MRVDKQRVTEKNNLSYFPHCLLIKKCQHYRKKHKILLTVRLKNELALYRIINFCCINGHIQYHNDKFC